MGKREIAIEYGIPCPGPKRPTGPRTPFTRAVYTMKQGGSVFCETAGQRDMARTIIKRLGGAYLSRLTVEDEVAGWRVWRTK